MKPSTLLLLGLFMFLFVSALSAQIYHVEPPNWWAGMKNQNLQLLVHGKDVGDMVPVLSYPGIVIQKVNEADSKNYLFVDLYIAATAKPGPLTIFFVKEGDTISTHKYTLLARQNSIPVKGFNSSD